MGKENTVSDYIFAVMAVIIVLLIKFVAISFMWVGAETVIIGAPNYDLIDQIVAACIAIYSSRKSPKSK